MFGEGAVKDEFDFIDAFEVVSGGSSGILLSVQNGWMIRV